MTELKRTITTEETYSYEAFDGCRFSSKESCLEYEASAFAVAKKTANAYLTKGTDITCVLEWAGREDEAVKVYNIPDAEALQIVNTYLHLVDSYGSLIRPDMIGHKVAIKFQCDEEYYCIMGTRDEMLQDLTKNLDRLFADPADKEAQ